jgi:hypothetical protein
MTVATCYLLLATCYLLLATCYLLLATCYLLLATCYLHMNWPFVVDNFEFPLLLVRNNAMHTDTHSAVVNNYSFCSIFKNLSGPASFPSIKKFLEFSYSLRFFKESVCVAWSSVANGHMQC